MTHLYVPALDYAIIGHYITVANSPRDGDELAADEHLLTLRAGDSETMFGGAEWAFALDDIIKNEQGQHGMLGPDELQSVSIINATGNEILDRGPRHHVATIPYVLYDHDGLYRAIVAAIRRYENGDQ